MSISAALSNGLGGIGSSYAVISDLYNLSLPTPGEVAYIDAAYTQAPYTVTGLTLRITITDDGIVNPTVVFTFPANYASLDLLCAGINIPKIQAVNNGGILRIQTLKTGIAQGIEIISTGTANSVLGFNTQQNMRDSGRSTITSELKEDEMTYALVAASAIADSFLQRRYLLPIKKWGYDLIQAVCDIAAYNLLKRKGWNPEEGDTTFSTKYNAAMTWLSDVGNRKEHPALMADAAHNLVPYAGTTNLVDDIRGWQTVIGSMYNY